MKKTRMDTKIATDAATTDNAAVYLDESDMHKLFHLSGKAERISGQIGNIQREAQVDELNLKLAQEQLQRLQAEFAVRNQRRIGDIQHLTAIQKQVVVVYDTFKASLSTKYGVDMNSVAIDDETGRLVIPPGPDGESSAV